MGCPSMIVYVTAALVAWGVLPASGSTVGNEIDSAGISIDSPSAYQVFQRSQSNTSDIAVRVTPHTPGDGVEVRLLRHSKADKGCGWRTCTFQAGVSGTILQGVPVGGPYTLQVRSGGLTRSVEGLLVGDLWVLAGQSNMDGWGKLVNLEPPSPMVNCFYHGDVWRMAKDPLCALNESVDPCHCWSPREVFQDSQYPEDRLEAARYEKAFGEWGAGLGVRFGKDLHKATGVPVGLLMCSCGGRSGTTLDMWDPARRDEGGNSLYGSLIRRVRAAGGKVAGLVWYQGESDALVGTTETDYKGKFRNLVASFRRDVRDPDLPVLYVQLSRTLFGCSNWNAIQNAQLGVEDEITNVAFSPAIDGALSDEVHIDATSQRRLASRLAKLALKLTHGLKVERGPRPADALFPDRSRKQILVTFSDVNGRLQATEGIRGFWVEKDGVRSYLASVEVGPKGNSILITAEDSFPEGSRLWYGRGTNPTTNLSDSEGFPCPVFGPVIPK